MLRFNLGPRSSESGFGYTGILYYDSVMNHKGMLSVITPIQHCGFEVYYAC